MQASGRRLGVRAAVDPVAVGAEGARDPLGLEVVLEVLGDLLLALAATSVWLIWSRDVVERVVTAGVIFSTSIT